MDPAEECKLTLSDETIEKVLEPIKDQRMFVPESRRLKKTLEEMNRKIRTLESTYGEAFRHTQELEKMLAVYQENWA